MEKLVIIDGNSLMNRAFYALPPLTTNDGKNTNAVFGFCNIMLKIIAEIKPSNFVVTFDMSKPTFRHEMYAEYKANRHGMPPELAEQMPLIQDVLKTMNVKVLQKEGIEADDIIGTLSKRFDIPTIIVTGDRDSLQLVDKNTEVWLTKKGISEIDILNNDNFKEKMGIIPKQIIDLKGLMGDASDNIPGIPGVGEKTAMELLTQYESVENLYLHTDELKGAKQRKVVENKELAFLSKKLATINTNCDIPCELNDTVLTLPFPIEVKDLFQKLQFTSLLKRLDNANDLDAEKVELQNSLMAQAKKIMNENELITVLQNNLKDTISFIEVDDTIHFAFDNKTEYEVESKFCEFFIDVMQNKNILKILYNSKLYHHKFFSKIDTIENYFDILVASHLNDSEIKESDKIKINLQKYDISNGYATALFNAKNLLTEELKSKDMFQLYEKMEAPLIDVLYKMEKVGIKIDKTILDNLNDDYTKALSKIEYKIYDLAGEIFNINSPKKLGEILFDKLKIDIGKNKKRSTNIEVLEKLVNSHPIIPEIMRYRKLNKLVSTYLDGFTKFIGENDLIHTEYEQTITSTGRLSSTNPNLQNIPVKDDDGKNLRRMFVPRDADNVFVGADYNQIELRLLAHFSQDELLLSAFRSGKDIHSATASEIFGVPFEAVTPEMRRTAKTVNFGIIYGISEYGLSVTLGTSPKIAKSYIDKYFEKYSKVKEYLDNSIQIAKENGFAKTQFGRKRYIPELQSSNKMVVKFGERVAMNMPLQGTGSEIIKLAMIETEKKIQQMNLKAKLLLQIHDELIIECPQNECEIVKKLLADTMENIVKLSVPLPVSIESGKSWFDL